MDTRQEVKRILDTYENYGSAARWSGENPGNQANCRMRLLDLRTLLANAKLPALAEQKILEIGCGTGGNLSLLEPLGARRDNMYGTDLRADAIEAAKVLFPGIHFSSGNGEQLNFGDHSFDMVMFFTVFSSILDKAMAANLAAEAMRVLRPGGAIVWYDMRYRNPSNKHVRPLGLPEIASLFPACRRHVVSTTVAPPLARRMGWLTRFAHPVLQRIPPLRTHYLAVMVKAQ